ncbi:MAG: ABC transporter ATP-binding protein [Phycisphaerales bacterium]
MISVREVHKSFGRVRAVRGVSFDLEPGRVAGLLGPNGAGKSTTIRMITGFLPPDRGGIEVCGHDTISRSLEARRQIGYLPESAPLYTEMSVQGYLDHRARLWRMPRADRRRAIDRCIDRCELRTVRRRRVGHLSKGFRQRVGLAAAMLHDPKVLILDEPSNGLDPTQIVHTRRLVRDLAEGRTVLVSSHILAEVERTCDRVIVIAGGEVRADGPPADLSRGRVKPACVVEFKAASPAWLERVAPDASVTLTSLPDSWTRARIEGAGDIREPLAAAASTAGVPLRELHLESTSLERLFIDLIESAP